MATSEYFLEDNWIYISHLNEAPRKYWLIPNSPDTITDSMQSSFSETNALGRTAPVFTFNNSGPRKVQINISLLRDLMDAAQDNLKTKIKLQPGEDYTENFINALQAIAVPKYNLTNSAVEPPLVAVRFGTQLFIKGVVTSGVTVTYAKPILSNGKYNKVDIAFEVSEVDPYDATSVYQNGGFRGLVKTMEAGMYGKEE